MNNLIKQILESKFNFNIDNELEVKDNLLSKSLHINKTLLDACNEHFFADLGFPSGTLWAKYNLGVNEKWLYTKSSWYGDYYAWGEIKPKKEYTWENYKFTPTDDLTKYSIMDDLTKLLLEDDVAYQFNNGMKMPTKELFEELLKYTTNKWIEKYYGIEELYGRLFTSKINGELLFIPASGYICQDWFYQNNSYCGYSCLWSSSRYDGQYGAWHLKFSLDRIDMKYEDRYIGFAVRPVLNRN